MTVATFCNRIMVGQASTPAMLPVLETTRIVAPHERAGHFRTQPRAPARSSLKLIFVTLMLVHAARLGGQALFPNTSKITAGSVRP